MSVSKEGKKIELLQSCFAPETADIIEICKKMTYLEKNWLSIFSRETESLAKQTAPGECTVEQDGVTIKIYAASNAIVTALKFKEKIFRAAIEGFLKTRVKKMEFAVGRVKRISTAKQPYKAFERYAPLVVSDDAVQREKKKLMLFTEEENLAGVIAKTKVMAEKKAKRLA